MYYPETVICLLVRLVVIASRVNICYLSASLVISVLLLVHSNIMQCAASALELPRQK